MQRYDLASNPFPIIWYSNAAKRPAQFIQSYTVKIAALTINCQAQFQLASPMSVHLRLALSLIISTPPTPGKVEMQLEIGHIWSVGSSSWLVQQVESLLGDFLWQGVAWRGTA